MTEVQQDIYQTNFLDSKDFFNNLMFVKAEVLDRGMEDLKKRMDKYEQDYLIINDRLKNVLLSINEQI